MKMKRQVMKISKNHVDFTRTGNKPSSIYTLDPVFNKLTKSSNVTLCIWKRRFHYCVCSPRDCLARPAGTKRSSNVLYCWIPPGALTRQSRGKNLHKRWKVFLHRLPEDVQVDIEISMNQTVAHANNVIPGNVRKVSSRILRNLIGGFPDDLDVLNQGERQFAVTDQILAAAILGELDGFTAASSICRRRIRSSLRILDLRLIQNLLTEITAQIFRCAQIHLAPA